MMSKLILGLAALTAGSVMAIESANIVGYQTKEMAPDTGMTGTCYYLISPTFEDVGSEGMNISKIVPVAENIASGDISFQILSTSRKADKTYSWEPVVYKKDGVTVKIPQGWYDATTGELDEAYVLTAGQSILISAPYAFSITFNGQVKATDTVFSAPGAGYYTIGNNSPVAINIKDLVPVAAGEEIVSGDINFQVLNNMRKADKTYSWEPVVYKKDGVTVKIPQGWYDATTGELDETYELPAGGAILLYTPKAITITIPSAVK